MTKQKGLAGVLATAGLLATSAHAGLAGHSVVIFEDFPTAGTVFGTNGPLVIAPGGTDFGVLGQSHVDGLVDDTHIRLTPLSSYTPLAAPFNGFDIRDLTGTIGSVALDPSSAPLPAGDFWLGGGGHDVFVNLAGVPLAADAAIVIDVSTVPEPSTWVAMLAGVLAVGFALRGRRQTAAAG